MEQKFIFILIDKRDINNINGFFDRKTMTEIESNELNAKLKSLVWVKTPNAE